MQIEELFTTNYTLITNSYIMISVDNNITTEVW